MFFCIAIEANVTSTFVLKIDVVVAVVVATAVALLLL
jgi:hypothetical protein